MQSEVCILSEEAATAWARLVRVSQVVLSRVEADLKAAGFPPLSWYDALLELERAKPEGLRPYQLQERMLLAQYNLSRLTDRLKKAGYIEREECPKDGRGQVLKVTEKGCALLRSMWPIYRRAIVAHFADKLDASETAALALTLMKLR
ncbi:MarR family winged helix-turn-helix transcriptional regulator [Albidovulum sediminis]|uniref:MarR family winged helix-turn-helix transcriptional regulator n=1 Tax=Albidovulum sediminis TaxID=3066345 RepID=A0ABT2NIY5_9RHOB|nr:MarR family winged helix-turn-helix transcriptional regulator [Defluviimonas sediminis]MCT8328886.1 MarR family winged helix-turn-helix transcriptional regulator [Defluviimonas sediminis]